MIGNKNIKPNSLEIKLNDTIRMKIQLTIRRYKAIVDGVQRDYSLSAKIFKKIDYLKICYISVSNDFDSCLGI